MRLQTKEQRLQYRQAMVNEGSIRDARSNELAEVYIYTIGKFTPEQRDGNIKYVAKGFIGAAGKPSFHYSFNTEAKREQHIAEFFANQQARHDAKLARSAEKATFRHTLKVGDIAHTSWGYDQTNVDFYEVTRIVSDKSVAVRPIKCTQETHGSGMCGMVTALPGQFCGPESVRRVRQGNVIVNVEHGRYSAYPNKPTQPIGNSWYA